MKCKRSLFFLVVFYLVRARLTETKIPSDRIIKLVYERETEEKYF
jgi:hypothetical protein